MDFQNINFDKKTILITGGAGFIGSSLAFYFQNHSQNARIVIFDCFRNENTLSNGNLSSFGHYKNLIGFDGEIICGNINNPQDLEILNSYKFDYIFHQAAISDTRVYDQELVTKTNINSFYWFLEKTKQDKATMVYASSAATYGNLPPPQKIGFENPENPYGYSKYVMDKVAIKFIKTYPDLNIFGLRFFNVYGPNEYYKNKTSSMVIQLGHQIMSGANPRLFENSANYFRDFVYIEDVIQANIKACLSINSGIYNVGSGVSRSFQDVADILQKELGTSYKTEYFKNPYFDYQSDTRADISLTKSSLGYKPEFSLETGIKKYIPYIKKTFELPFE